MWLTANHTARKVGKVTVGGLTSVSASVTMGYAEES